MASIQVKNVPSDVHQTLRERAVGAGQSLQDYLLQLLCELARTPTVGEVLERAVGRSGGNFSAGEAVAAVRAERDSLRGLNFAEQFEAEGRPYVELDDNGNVVRREPLRPDATAEA